MNKLVRTRFAPSPTGFLHVGGIRTALFAWLVARQNSGEFILRIEDTDKNREVAESSKQIIDSLQALGLDYDEGPDKNGQFGPYLQSERLDIYHRWANKLIEQGRAYADPYTPSEVQAFREQAQKAKQPFLYRNHRPENPPVWDGKTPLRFKSEPKSYQWHDEVMGDLSTGPEVIDDFILIKSDGYPTYNFAHIVDDSEMHITHVIRGQEFIASQPNYLNLYEALNLEIPKLAHLPHIMNEQGNKKLSKRDGAKDVLTYINEGYLPEALRSFIATLGWNDGTTQEVFTTKELIEKFSLDQVGKSGAHFDEKRLSWVNGHFIRALDISDLYTRCQDFWPKSAQSYDKTYKMRVLELVQERLKFLSELPELTSFFFEEPTPNIELIKNNKQLKKYSLHELKELLKIAQKSLEASDFTPEDLQLKLNQLLEVSNQKPAVLFSIIRLATTWASASPQLNQSLSVLGKEASLKRISHAINTLSSKP